MPTLPLEIFYIYFSPYTAHAIVVDGVVYPTVEHAYQCSRYKDEKIRKEIRGATSPVKAWQISTKYKHLQIAEFKNPDFKRQMMKKLMRLKLEQHEEVRKALLDSGKLLIVKKVVTYPPGDGWWDIGDDGKGENVMGKIWMELREELQRHA